jgi:hypothetical protein
MNGKDVSEKILFAFNDVFADIVNGLLFDGKQVDLYDTVPVPEIIKPYLSNIKINVFEIAFLSREKLSHFHSDFRTVVDYFIQMRENGEYIPSSERLQHVEAVLQLLSIMTDDTRFEDVLNQKDYYHEGGVHNMCEWLDRVEAASRAEGMAKGMAKGEIIGTIKLYTDEMHLMPGEITEKIMARFSLEKEDAEKYVAEVLGLQPA